MTYSYARRSFPRRMPRRPGGAAGWVALFVLVIAIGSLWWAKGGRTADDTPIIASPAAINNPLPAAAEPTETSPTETKPAQAQSVTLTLKGVTVWGVQLGAFSTGEAAEAARPADCAVFFSGGRHRVMDSLWPDREAAVARRQALEAEGYVTEVSTPSVNLKLGGSQEKLDAVSRAAGDWEAGLSGLLKAQAQLAAGENTPAEALEQARQVREAFASARAAIPDETEVLQGMRDALEASIAALDEILAENAGKEVDFVRTFRYNILICYNVYNMYAVNLISSS